MAQWDSGVWGQSYWSATVGYMAATESGTDTFAAEGDVQLTGYMAATETGVDTFSATGTVEVQGYMAAVETGVDVFSATGTVEVQGYMAATETGVDVFSASGDVEDTGYMAATETGVDVFSATGTVEVTGYMAAVETGVDVFSAEGTVGLTGYMAATETEVDTFYATGTVTPQPTPQPVVTADIGPGDEKQRKKAQKKRDEYFEREKAEQLKLREQIERVINPVVAKAQPVVVSEAKKSVQVLSVDGSRIGIDVPADFDVAEVARIVAEVLEEAKVEAMRVKRRQDAERALAIARVTVARIIKRKQDDELLLLLD